MLKRKIYDDLMRWKSSAHRKCLMLYGARQVGKTYIVREFGKREYQSFIELNFIESPDLKSVFDGSLSAETIYKRITASIDGARLIPGDTLVFLDEIQVCGNARTAIKFLSEDGRYDVISSGSLLGLTYAEDADTNVEEVESLPVGYEDFLTMYPLDFEEFLWAMGVSSSQISTLKDYFNTVTNPPEIVNRKYIELFREYIVVGGMPEAVASFADEKDYTKVNEIQRSILQTYRDDISKHAKGAEKTKVRACYDAIPRQLAKELKKFQYATVEKGKTSKKYGGSVQWLKDSAVVDACYNIGEPYLPLKANEKEEQFKLYINDSGLLCTMYGFETKKGILNNTLKGSAKGGIYENVIAGGLVRKGYSLHYYKPDDNHEIEFLIEKEGDVVPIEVKAGNNSTVSLNSFIERYDPHVAYKLIDGGVGSKGALQVLPHYMFMFI
ncbi:MAG: ATP-binding protein [Clostridia bacterium]|nr:ATP-binding protein [Clostridia bacterium]